MQTVGLGGMRHNTVVVGWPDSWHHGAHDKHWKIFLGIKMGPRVNKDLIYRGSTYCFTAGGTVSASHQLLRHPLLKFFWVACFLFPRSLAFDFCYDLDIWGQGQALRALFVVMSFFTILSKYVGDFDKTWQEAS